MGELNLIQYFKYNGLSICSLFFFIFILATSVSNFKNDDGKMNYNMSLFLIFYSSSIILEILLPFCFIHNLFKVSVVYRIYASLIIFSHCMLLFLTLKYTNVFNEKNKKFFPIIYVIIFSIIGIIMSVLPGDFDVLPCAGPVQKVAELLTICVDTLLIVSIFSNIITNKVTEKKVGNVIRCCFYISFAYICLLFLTKIFDLVVFNPSFFVTMIFYLFILIFENRDTEYNQKLVNQINDTTLIYDSKKVFTEKFMSSIKVPMHNIVGLSSVLKEENYNDNLEDNIKIITKSNVVLNNKIEEVKEINSIISGNTKLIEKEYNLKELINRLENNINKQINNNKSFNIVCNEDLDINIIGDSDKIYKTLYYLISLAIENTLEGEITLNIDITLDKNVYNINYKISNPGIKINKEIFDKKFIDFADKDGNIYDIKEELLIAKFYADVLLSPISLVNNDKDTEYVMSIEQLVSNRGE